VGAFCDWLMDLPTYHTAYLLSPFFSLSGWAWLGLAAFVVQVGVGRFLCEAGCGVVWRSRRLVDQGRS